MPLALILCSCDNPAPAREHKRAAPGAKPAPDTGPPIEVTARELFDLYAKDRGAADAKWLGKRLRVHGIVGEHGRTSLELQTAGGRSHVEAWFTDVGAPAIRTTKRGDEVFLLCTGGELTDVPWLNDCELERVVAP